MFQLLTSLAGFFHDCNCRLRDFQSELVDCNRLFGYDQAIKSPDPSYGVTAKCFHCRDEHCSSALAKQAIVRQGDPIAFHVGTGLDLPPANCIRSECRTSNACPYGAMWIIRLRPSHCSERLAKTAATGEQPVQPQSIPPRQASIPRILSTKGPTGFFCGRDRGAARSRPPKGHTPQETSKP